LLSTEPGLQADFLLYWEKAAVLALFPDIAPGAGDKKRGFCRLARRVATPALSVALVQPSPVLARRWGIATRDRWRRSERFVSGPDEIQHRWFYTTV
jgi:hypothetical protein